MLKFRRFASISGAAGVLNKSPREIALRACCTQLLLTRWTLESATQTEESRGREAFQALTETIQKTEIQKHMTTRELDLMNKDYRGWDMVQDVIPLETRWESFGMLLWALCIVKNIPAYYERFPHEAMYKSTAIIPAFSNTIDQFIEYFSSGPGTNGDHVPTQQEFSEAIAIAEAWHWRSRAQLVLDLKISLGKEPEHLAKIPAQLRTVMNSIEKSIEAAAERAYEDKLISDTCEGDFAVKGGNPYKDMGDHDMRDVANVTEARLNALGWLTGTHEWEYQSGDVKFIHPLGSLWTPHQS